MNFDTEGMSKLLDLNPGQAALMDEQGKIRAVSCAWTEFRISDSADNSKSSEPCHWKLGFAIDSGDGSAVSTGIRNVLNGATDAFDYSYGCLASAGLRRFRLTATPFSPSGGARWALLRNTDLTDQHPDKEDIVSVCAWCKRIQEGDDLKSFETYFSERWGTQFSHGICPECRDLALKE